MNIVVELLSNAAQRDARQIDEDLVPGDCATLPMPELKTAEPRR